MEFPIQNQEQFDQAIKSRLQRERERWEKEVGIDEYKQRAEEAETRAFGRLVDRDARDVLSKGMNVDPARHGRILRLAELPSTPGEDGEPDRRQIMEAFKGLHSDMPEVFGSEATVVETALDTSTGDSDQDASLTVERIEALSDEQINEPGMWERVQRFMVGERG